ncbi:MAG TPA: AbrB/MazE/SpoVT family DNA-binding domain-containing protein [archaeon]|nr:AbrB/MazE/SpoVT family DNA-binding domain-containing protein [archaeon]
MEIEITKMSSRGQVVIPQEIREKEGLKEGEKFIVVDINGTIILKRVKNISMEEFENTFKPIHAKAKGLNITEKDIEEEIQAYRKEKHGN